MVLGEYRGLVPRSPRPQRRAGPPWPAPCGRSSGAGPWARAPRSRPVAALRAPPPGSARPRRTRVRSRPHPPNRPVRRREGGVRPGPGQPPARRAAPRCAAASSRPPARRPGLRVLRRRVPQQQREQLAAAALALTLLLALRLRVALDRVGRELVDVGEDRLGEQAELLGVDAAAPGGGRDAPPGDPRADAVGGLQGVQGPPLPQLAPAQADVDLAPGPRPASGSRIRATNWRSASLTPVRIAAPKAPSSGRAYSGTSRAIVARISSVTSGSSGSITSASSAGRPRHGSCGRFLSSR